jgi:CheY-like chemotaxis protein
LQERILLVEDEPLVLQYATAQLTNFGYSVTSAPTGPEALAILEQDRSFDLLFTDVVLPRAMSGVELVRRARILCPGLKVLMTSGYSEDAFQLHGRPEAGTVMLPKPYRRQDLADAIRRALLQV